MGADAKWWQTGVIYQIYSRSFQIRRHQREAVAKVLAHRPDALDGGSDAQFAGRSRAGDEPRHEGRRQPRLEARCRGDHGHAETLKDYVVCAAFGILTAWPPSTVGTRRLRR